MKTMNSVTRNSVPRPAVTWLAGLFAASTLLTAFAGCASLTPPVRMTQSANGHRIEIKTGQPVTVTLDPGPSPGAKWEVVEAAPTVLDAQGSETHAGATTPGGVVGIHDVAVYHFNAARSGSDSLRLVLRTPPGADSLAVPRRFACLVVVR